MSNTDLLNDTYFFSEALLYLAQQRYFRKGKQGELLETDISQVFQRVVDFVYSNDTPLEKELALQLIREKKVVPGGRPLAQAGTTVKNLCNCFVIAFEADSKEAISELKRKHMNIQAQGGGTGIDFSSLRPAGSICVTNQAVSSGSIGFAVDIGYQSSNISQGGNRSGANLGVLDCRHPDLWDFIVHKSTHNWENIRRFATIFDEDKFAHFQWENPHQLQTFNVSVLLTDEFMQEVIDESDKPWTLVWREQEWALWDFVNHKGPKTGNEYEHQFTVTAPTEEMAWYKASTKIPFFNRSSLELIRGPYHIPAKQWFRRIAQNAWEDGCPGVMFIDRVRQYHNGEYFNPISAANPCAEEPLPNNGVCSLTSLCLPSFYNAQQMEFDFKEFKKAIVVAVRFLDNLTDLTYTGEADIDENIRHERRIGVGTTGLAELLILEGLRYDSPEALAYTETILQTLRDTAYEASIDLARERGPFPAYNYEGFSRSEFFKSLPGRLQRRIKEHGIRHVTLLTQPPVGTTGVAIGFSQGPEPYYGLVYKRNSRVGTFVDGSPAFRAWLEQNEINYEDFDCSLAQLKEQRAVPDYFVEAHEIHPEDHIRMQAVFAKYIDSSVSKTVNLPSQATVGDVEQAFLLAYQLGIKSTTIYRDGSKEQICEKMTRKGQEERPHGIVITGAPKRPKELQCDIHNTTVKGEKWTVLVGLMDNKPYEVFCAQEESFEIPSKYKTGVLVKAGSGKYHLDLNGIKLKNITAQLESDEHRVITRLISTALRHGVPLDFINEQLHKAQGTVTDFSKAILRVLKRYSKEEEGEQLGTQCPVCSGRNVIRSGGCPSCLDCGWSKCE